MFKMALLVSVVQSSLQAAQGIGDGTSALSAQLNYPNNVKLDAIGNLYIAESDMRIRKVTVSTGVINTIAMGTPGRPGPTGDGGPAAAARFSNPKDIVVDAAGNLYIADMGDSRLRRVTTDGLISSVATLPNPFAVALGPNGDLYFVQLGGLVGRVTGGFARIVAGSRTGGQIADGGLASSGKLGMRFGAGIAVDATGNLYIAEDERVRKITSAGVIRTIAGNGTPGFSGDGGPAISAQLNIPMGIAIDTDGNLYIADSGNVRIRKVTTEGVIRTVAGNGTTGLAGDGGVATEAKFNEPTGVAVDSGGNLYIADRGNGRIRKVTKDGRITTVAGSTKPPGVLGVVQKPNP